MKSISRLYVAWERVWEVGGRDLNIKMFDATASWWRVKMKIKNISNYRVEMRKRILIIQIWDMSLLCIATHTCMLMTIKQISSGAQEESN